MNVLVTGAAGFIGSHVTRQLVRDGNRVMVVLKSTTDAWRITDLRNALTVVTADLREDNLNRRLPWEPDTCIHLAWKGWAHDPKAIESLHMSVGLLRQMSMIGCQRFVHAGSCFEYAGSPEPLTEKSPLGPHELYGVCKKAFHEVAQSYGRLTGFHTATARIFYVYGPMEETHRLVPHLSLALLAGETPEVTHAHLVRDYLHVTDVASAIYKIAVSDVVGAVNVASGAPTPLGALGRRLAELPQPAGKVRLGAAQTPPGEPLALVADVSRLTDLGWMPHYSLDAGLEQTFGWWRARA